MFRSAQTEAAGRGGFGTDLSVDSHRPLEDAVHAQDGGLRRVDDGSAEQRAENAAVTDGERATVHVLDRQRPWRPSDQALVLSTVAASAACSPTS